MRRLRPLVLVFVLGALVLWSCSGGPEPTVTTAPKPESVLTDAKRAAISEALAVASDYVSLYRLTESNTGIAIWIELRTAPTSHAEISMWTDSVAEVVAKLFDYDVYVLVDAIRPIPGSDKPHYYGNTTFSPSTGKFEYIGCALPEVAADKGGTPSGSAVLPPPPPEPDKIELSGKGDYATRFIELETGLAIFGMTHGGQSNFIVQLLDSDGGLVDLLVNGIGRYEGYVGQGVRKGKYLLNINADGQWAVVIMQPRPATGTKPPLTSNGTGDFVMGPMLLDKGLTRFALTHGGSSNFIITLFDYNGNWVELLVNEIGGYSGSQAIQIPKEGVYWLNITADGTWTADVTK